jgi:trimeric autotransporter adhesin
MGCAKIFLAFFFFCVFPLSAQNSWSALGTGVNNSVYCLSEYNGELYAGGVFTTAGGVPASHIARWNGMSWDSVGPGFSGNVWALCVYNGELYAGGFFQYSGSLYCPGIARWNGTSWSQAGSGMYGGVYALEVYNGKLYAGGTFTSADGVPVNRIAQWNGTNWDSVGAGISNRPGDPTPVVEALATYQNKLAVGGRFTRAGGQPAHYVATWNDTAWAPVGPIGAAPVGAEGVYALREYNSMLYAGGGFDSLGNSAVDFLASWNGVTWSQPGNGVSSYVYALRTDSQYLYIGGYFGVPTSRIARWNGSFLSGFGNGTSALVSAIAFYNGEMHVGGQFVMASSVLVNRIARWGVPTGIPLNDDPGEGLNVFPNPAQDQLTLSLPEEFTGDVRITIMDVTGACVFSSMHDAGTTSIHVGFLAAGTYVLEVQSDEGVLRKKFVKL